MPLDGTLYEDEVLLLLRSAQERIRKPENWCKGLLWQTSLSGTRQWCAFGTVYDGREVSFLQMREATNLLNRAAMEMGHVKVGQVLALVNLNNSTDHPTVMVMFDRAIELREAEIRAEVLA